MIDSIISNMYYGPLEREPFFKKSTCYKLFDKITDDALGTDDVVTRSFVLFTKNHKFKSFKKYCKSQMRFFKSCKKKNSKFCYMFYNIV